MQVRESVSVFGFHTNLYYPNMYHFAVSLKNIIQILINDIFNLTIACRLESGNILKTTKDFILKNLLLSFMEIGPKPNFWHFY